MCLDKLGVNRPRRNTFRRTRRSPSHQGNAGNRTLLHARGDDLSAIFEPASGPRGAEPEAYMDDIAISYMEITNFSAFVLVHIPRKR